MRHCDVRFVPVTPCPCTALFLLWLGCEQTLRSINLQIEGAFAGFAGPRQSCLAVLCAVHSVWKSMRACISVLKRFLC